MEFKKHTNLDYEKDLAEVRTQVKEMAHQVGGMIGKSVEAFANKNRPLGKSIGDSDDAVDRAEKKIDQLCLSILARRQPLGEDLRFIATVLKIVTDIERIGDLATSIGARAVKISKFEDFTPQKKISRMGTLVEKMFADAIESFLRRDVNSARQVLKSDDELDDLYYQLVKKTISKLDKNNSQSEGLVHVHNAAKWLERMGDHCTNVAEQVVFMVDGKDIRHSDN